MTTAQEHVEAAWLAEDATQAFQLYREAARLADLEQNLEVAREARSGLLDASMQVGDSATLLGTFAWLLADADRESPDETPHHLLWRFKWALGTATALSSVPLKRLHDLLDDFARRTRAAGLGERTALVYRWRLELHRGDLVAAETHRKAVHNLKRTPLDCRACDQDLLVIHHLERGDLNAALKAAQPIFSGNYRCNRVPAGTYPDLLLPLHRAGRQAEAQAFHAQGYPLVKDDSDARIGQAQHLAYLLHSGQAEQAARLYQRHLPPHPPAEEVERFWWHAANAHPANRHSDPQAHHAEALDAARRLDQRNGTDAHLRRLEHLLSATLAT